MISQLPGCMSSRGTHAGLGVQFCAAGEGAEILNLKTLET